MFNRIFNGYFVLLLVRKNCTRNKAWLNNNLPVEEKAGFIVPESFVWEVNLINYSNLMIYYSPISNGFVICSLGLSGNNRMRGFLFGNIFGY
jgi:hypothetical protein